MTVEQFLSRFDHQCNRFTPEVQRWLKRDVKEDLELFTLDKVAIKWADFVGLKYNGGSNNG